MDQPATDTPMEAATEWLIDADDRLLTSDKLARIAEDPNRPDRLAWNTFRTLALWNTDTWVPALLEEACGGDNPLSPLNWADTAVVPWAAGLDSPDTCNVALDGPEAYVMVACALTRRPAEEQLRAAAMAALEGSLHPNREAGLVVVLPPGDDPEGESLTERLEIATGVELLDGRLAYDLLAPGMGDVTWLDLGRLALDLAEEAELEPAESVRRLVTELQQRFPGAQL
jgi:hypothetical protein